MDLEKIHAAAERVARSLGMEVVEVEWQVGKQRFLRVYIDRPEGPANPSGAGPASALGAGVSHKDCQAVSEQLSVILDVEELVPGPRYILEISSPGLDRKLIKPSDYDRFAGKKVKLLLRNVEGGRRSLQGLLRGWDEGKIRIEDESGATLAIAFDEIEKANLVPEFGKELGKKSESEKAHSR